MAVLRPKKIRAHYDLVQKKNGAVNAGYHRAVDSEEEAIDLAERWHRGSMTFFRRIVGLHPDPLTDPPPRFTRKGKTK